jgi:hypothetical protein
MSNPGNQQFWPCSHCGCETTLVKDSRLALFQPMPAVRADHAGTFKDLLGIGRSIVFDSSADDITADFLPPRDSGNSLPLFARGPELSESHGGAARYAFRADTGGYSIGNLR